ncbi:MAG: DNA methyltransferase [Proteobacteria bacterium SG_bin7]|nr:MAG: DNA methyltransferase [Proteobacteria bacterium SG_bin7]
MQTEGIKYAGSKKAIIPSILEICTKLQVKSAFDGFAGTTRVSQGLYKIGIQVHSNDISDWSYIFGLCYLKNSKPAEFYEPLLEHLNNLPGKSGWFSENYGGMESDEKKIWQIHNTQKLDAIREEIERLRLDEVARAVLLTSLILAMDKVDSSLGHHTSYLKKWAPRSFATMKMVLPKLISVSENKNKVIRGDVFDTVKNISTDLAYFDPPYGSSNEKMPPSRVRYASYYHLWTTIIRNDQPKLVGAAKRRQDVSDVVATSVFEEFRRSESGKFIALEAIEQLIRLTPAPYIVLSYSNQGRATRDNLVELISSYARAFSIVEHNHKSHVMRSMCWTKNWANLEEGTKEYLFVLNKK